jgi:hypothetical protein
MSYQDDLHHELRALSRGRGMLEQGLARRLGPLTRQLSAVSAVDPDPAARQRLHLALTELMVDLEAEVRAAAELALAFDARSGDHLMARARFYAKRAHCSERTARRRMNEAIAALAQAGARDQSTAPVDPGSGWRVRSFTSLMRLDSAAVELYETRVLLAEREISEVQIELDIPSTADSAGPPPGVDVHAVYGARIVTVDRDDDGHHYRLSLALPRPLSTGDQQEFCLHYRVRPGTPVRNHCAIVPLAPCDHGRIRVRFPEGRAPASIWQVTAVPPRRMDAATTVPGAARLDLDGAGEVMVAFRALRQGHGYGVAWLP